MEFSICFNILKLNFFVMLLLVFFVLLSMLEINVWVVEDVICFDIGNIVMSENEMVLFYWDCEEKVLLDIDVWVWIVIFGVIVLSSDM